MLKVWSHLLPYGNLQCFALSSLAYRFAWRQHGSKWDHTSFVRTAHNYFWNFLEEEKG